MVKNSFSHDFITALIKKAQLADDKGQVDQEYVEKLSEQLDKKMGLFLLSKLSAEDLNEYYQLVDDGGEGQKLHDFLASKIDNFSAQQKKFLDDYAFNFLNRSTQIKQALNK